MGKKPIFSVTYENERTSTKKKQLTLLKMCATSLVWSTGRFMGFYVNGFLSHVTHISSKVSCFLLKSFPFFGYRNDRFFSHTNPYISNITQQCHVRRWSYFELALLVVVCYTAVFSVSGEERCVTTLKPAV